MGTQRDIGQQLLSVYSIDGKEHGLQSLYTTLGHYRATGDAVLAGMDHHQTAQDHVPLDDSLPLHGPMPLGLCGILAVMWKAEGVRQGSKVLASGQSSSRLQDIVVKRQMATPMSTGARGGQVNVGIPLVVLQIKLAIDLRLRHPLRTETV